jgi:phosphoenolpyruvate carboxykinase (ATP)
MQNTEKAKATLTKLGINETGEIFHNLSAPELIEHAVRNGEGVLTDTGGLMCDTGKFTGRSPKDKFVVKDSVTENTVWWGDINQVLSNEKFDSLLKKVLASFKGKRIYMRDAYACADPKHKLTINVINTSAWHNLFCYNLFLRPTAEETKHFDAEWTIINNPEFQAAGAEDGVRQGNFTIINFAKKIILIGGSAYTGEMKKGIFSVLNYVLPQEKKILSMHCSANIGKNGDTAIFFGLSGTGKTTLSADPERGLIGDDEHGWTDEGVFNFEGGCYAKAVDLTREKEPQIFDAVKFGSLVENTRFYEGTRTVDYKNIKLTENTRVAYPIHHIDNAVEPSVGGIPKNIFFLTCDASGVLPPISRLNTSQAMYHFISGFTAKVAGTEMGITEPQLTFSACFGSAFLPLHPTKYAELLGNKMKAHKVNVWLVNTGWSGGGFGVGQRMKLSFTRAMITAALTGELDKTSFKKHDIFGVEIPATCPNVPTEILDPRNTWADKASYDEKANNLAHSFVKNFEKYKSYANEEILAGAPQAKTAATA